MYSRNSLRTALSACLLMVSVTLFQAFMVDSARAQTAGATGVLRIGINPGIEPMEYMRGGQLVGYDIDVGIELARHLKAEANWVVIDSLDELVQHVLEGNSGGKLDIVISAMGIDSERTANSIAVPYFKSGLTILTAAANTSVATLDSLKGMTVSAVVGSTEYGIVKQVPGVTVVDAKNYDECIALINSGAVSAVVLDVPVALAAAKRNPNKLRVADQPFEVEWYGIFMERSNLALFKQIRKAVKAMRQDGTFSRLNTKWF